MRKLRILLMLLLIVVSLGCAPNIRSFYVSTCSFGTNPGYCVYAGSSGGAPFAADPQISKPLTLDQAKNLADSLNRDLADNPSERSGR